MGAAIWETGDPSNPDNFDPYYYGPHEHNTMYHWNPNPDTVPTGGCAWVLTRYGGGFRSGHAGLQLPVFFSGLASTENETFPVHFFSIDCREAQQQFDQNQYSRKKFQCYGSTIEDGADDVNLGYQWVLDNLVEEFNLNPLLGGFGGTSSGSITSHGAAFLPQPAAYRGFQPGLYPHAVRPPWMAFAEVPWNPRWMRGSSGMDYAFVETAHNPDFLSDGDRDDAYAALNKRVDMFNTYENILTAGYQPYICSAYTQAAHGAFPTDFQLADPHDPRHGYYFHKRLADDLGYSVDKHKHIVTDTISGGTYAAPAADWWEVNTNFSATSASQWAWVKATIEALPNSGY